MKLEQLKNYSVNEFDKEIIDRMCKDNDIKLNKYIVSVISDFLEYIPLEENLKTNAKNNINTYDGKSIGKVATYISLIPYVQIKLKDKNDGDLTTSSLIENFISYIVGYISEEEFDENILNIRDTLEISDKFYRGLIIYFACNYEKLVKGINERLK